jgi:transposase
VHDTTTRRYWRDPEAIRSVSIDMSPAYIKGVTEHLPHAQITFDTFHVIAHASTAIDRTRRKEQKRDPALKGMCWALLKDRDRLDAEQRFDPGGALVNEETPAFLRGFMEASAAWVAARAKA